MGGNTGRPRAAAPGEGGGEAGRPTVRVPHHCIPVTYVRQGKGGSAAPFPRRGGAWGGKGGYLCTISNIARCALFSACEPVRNVSPWFARASMTSASSLEMATSISWESWAFCRSWASCCRRLVRYTWAATYATAWVQRMKNRRCSPRDDVVGSGRNGHQGEWLGLTRETPLWGRGPVGAARHCACRALAGAVE